MSGKYPPLTCKDIKAILSYLGFAFDTQRGSHEQWVLIKHGKKIQSHRRLPQSPIFTNLNQKHGNPSRL